MDAKGQGHTIRRRRKRIPKNIARLQNLFQPNTILDLYSVTESSSSETIPQAEDDFKIDEVAGASVQELNTGTKEGGDELVDKSFPLQLRLWRKLIFLLHYHRGKLSADENLVTLMQQFFQIDFKVCVDNIDFFVNNFLPKHFPLEDLIQLNTNNSLEPYLQFKILKINFNKQIESLNETLQKFQTSEETKSDAEKQRPHIPGKFAGFNDQVEWMSQYIRPNSHTICMGAEIGSLDCFYVNCLEFYEALNELMAKLQQEFKEVDQLRKSTPHPESLIPGLIVAVSYEGVNNLCSRPEFNRAKIIEIRKNEKEKKYLVLFIDYGELVEVGFDDIKYLPKHFLTGFPAQAIECEANVNPVYKSCRAVGWQKEVMQLFLKKIQRKKMNIHFCYPSTEQPRVGSGIKWVVSVDLVSDENLKIITESQIERKILMKLEEEYYESIPTRIDDIVSDDSMDCVD